MISNTRFNIILIRISILWFRSITPIATILSIGSLVSLILPARLFPPFSGPSSSPIARPILITFLVLAVSEPLFYSLVYAPYLRYLQTHTIPPEGNELTRSERRQLTDRLLSNVDDGKFWVSMWFRFRSHDERRASKHAVRQWLAWGVMNRYSLHSDDADEVAEVNEYLALLENRLGDEGVSLEEGSSSQKGPSEKRAVGKPIRVTIDPMRVLHRPLLYYVFGVGLIDTILFWKMWRMGFQHFPVRSSFQSFPWRPLSLLAKERSPSTGLSYWYRAHTSRKRLPVLYIHGIGVGLITYTDFFEELLARNNEGQDGQVGILAVEVMPISFRLSSPIPASQVLAGQIRRILHRHGWDQTKFVLAANSYGTVLATYLLRCPEVAPSIGPMVLIDPVTMWAHMGDIAYNFTVKQPESASEWQLWYFACTDMMAAHTVTRRFMWRDNVLWRDEIEARRVGFVLSGADIILDAGRLRRFLIGDRKGIAFDSSEGAELVELDQNANGALWEVLWFAQLNHAEVFEKPTERRLLADMVWKYCLKDGEPV